MEAPHTIEAFHPGIFEVPTPALVIESRVVRRNIQRLADYAASHRLQLRPHSKTHKSRRVGKLQLEAGAIGLTVAKAGEAAQMAPIAQDVLVGYPALDPARTRAIAEIARDKIVRVAVDSARAATALSEAALAAGSVIGLLVDLDVGLRRTGVASPVEALALAQSISKTRAVRLDGLFCYPGHIWLPADRQQDPLAEVAAKLEETIELWSKNGLEAKIVSGGSTPTAYQSHWIAAYTEIRPGAYVFNDMNTVRGSYCGLEDCAARVVCTVISDAVAGQVVLDGGAKTFSNDLCVPARASGHGHVLEYPEAKVTLLSEEHAQVDVSQCGRRPKIGERVSIIPNHVCPCVNLQDSFWWAEGSESLQQTFVDARGKTS